MKKQELSPRALRWLRELVEFDEEVIFRLTLDLLSCPSFRVPTGKMGPKGHFPDDIRRQLKSFDYLENVQMPMWSPYWRYRVTPAGRKAVGK